MSSQEEDAKMAQAGEEMEIEDAADESQEAM